MADTPLTPENIRGLKEHISEADRLLKSMSTSSEEISFHFNLAKDAVEDMNRKADVLKNKYLKNLAQGLVADLNKAQSSEDKIAQSKKVQARLQEEIRKNLVTKEELAILQQAHASVSEQLLRQKAIYLAQGIGLGNILKKHSSISNAIKSAASMFNVIGGVGTKISASLLKIATGAISLLAVTLSVTFGKLLNVFNQIDVEAAKFRMTMGVTRRFTGQIDADARNTWLTFMGMGVTAEQVYASVAAIAKSMGSTAGYTKGMMRDVSLMAAQLGISADTSVNFLRTMGYISQRTMASQRSMLGFASALSEAAGTNLGEVMSDIAQFSETSYRFMSRSTTEMIKAAVEARRLGTSLASAGKTADSLLNFTQSINAEMEASVLLGQSINLQRARELSYRRDIRGLNQEILRIAQQTDFEALDPIQQRSVATALGKSEEEIGKMLQAAREMRKLDAEAARDPFLKRRVENYRQLIALGEKQAQNEGKAALLDLQRQANQARLVSIQNQWNQLVQQLAEQWLPVIDDALAALLPVLRGISSVFAFIAKSLPYLTTAAGLGMMVLSAFPPNPALFLAGLALAGLGGYGVYKSMGPKLPDKEIREKLEPGSPHEYGRMWIDGFKAAEKDVRKSLEAPFEVVQQGMGPTGEAMYAEAARVRANVPAPAPVVDPVVTAINGLRDDLRTGGVKSNVIVDSQLLESATARARAFRRGYGGNTPEYT